MDHLKKVALLTVMIVFLAGTLLTGSLSKQGTIYAATLFSDDFEDGSSNGWTVVNGSWSVTPDGTKVFKQANTSGEALVYAGTSSWTNYTVEAKIKLHNTASTTASGILGRYVDSNNFYMLRLHSYDSKVELYKKAGGVFTKLNETAMTVSINTWYTMKLVLNGNSLTGYVNGVQKVSATDQSLANGCIGARAYAQSASYDDFLVTDNVSATPTPTPTATPTLTPTPTASPSGVTPTLNLNQRLLPVPTQSILADPNYYIWCGTMVQTPDGTCHLFYSRWPVARGFDAWATHSEVAYATANNPAGPYTHVAVALPARGAGYWDGLCTHNPTVHYFNGKYYLYYMGNTGDGTYWSHRNNQRIGVATADYPSGPWVRRDTPLIDVSPNSAAPDSLLVSNPSITRRPDGAYLMVYKAVGKAQPLPFGGPVVNLTATSNNPDGPFTKQLNPIFTSEGTSFAAEDPFIWYDSIESLYYAIVKDMGGYFTGVSPSLALFYSLDGFDWDPASNVLVSGLRFFWEDGRVQVANKLERPQLWFKNGAPQLLLLAIKDQNGSTYNIQMPIRPSNPNLVVNSGFESNVGQTISGWTEYSPNGSEDASYVETSSASHSGSNRLMQKKSGNYIVSTRQQINNLPSGTYFLRAWTKSSGGQNLVQMRVLNYGGSELRLNIPTDSEWHQMIIPNIPVTSGTCLVVFTSDAHANEWLMVDDVDFYLK